MSLLISRHGAAFAKAIGKGSVHSELNRASRNFASSAVLLSVALGFSVAQSSEPLSPPADWGADFVARSPQTDECVGGSLASLGRQMDVSAPVESDTFGEPIDDSIKQQVLASDTYHTFQFNTDPTHTDYWGFGGYLVARGDCIIYVKVLDFDN